MTARLLTAHGWTVDGPDVRCAMETWQCSEHSALAGGFDEHHRFPKSLGGPEHPDDLMILCTVHHRRQHAYIRAIVETGNIDVKPVRWYSTLERATARYAYTQWQAAGMPAIAGWPCPAAAVQGA